MMANKLDTRPTGDRPPGDAPTALLVSLAMLAFAGNSLLCRLALKHTAIDAASFTAVRLVAGAAALWLVVRMRKPGTVTTASPGDWGSALALFVYAALFSFAYVGMSAATGALLLFGAVQASMIGWALAKGERLRGFQWLGFFVALAGLVALMLPGLSTPDLLHSASMLAAGVAWGIYSLRGKSAASADPTAVTAGNFLRAAPLGLLLVAALYARTAFDGPGFALAVASGALTSGLGYAIWYRALPALQATHAATVQLSVPVIAAVGGVLLLGEALTLNLALASGSILGGIALVIRRPQQGSRH